MGDHNGNYWTELNYDGYGEFGGKDYYELLAEMNMVDPQYHNRDVGIDLEFKPENIKGERKHDRVVYPSLTERKPIIDNYYFQDQPESCPDQGFFYVCNDADVEDDDCGDDCCW